MPKTIMDYGLYYPNTVGLCDAQFPTPCSLSWARFYLLALVTLNSPYRINALLPRETKRHREH